MKPLGARAAAGAALTVLALATLGCAQDPDGSGARPACLSEVELDSCMPLYPPEFPGIFRHTLSVTCASSGVSCHGPDGAQGGLSFVTEDDAYGALLGQNGAHRRVVPGDPKCSELMVRLDTPGQDWSMPPGAPLDEKARCAIRRWIAAGSPRTAEGGS